MCDREITLGDLEGCDGQPYNKQKFEHVEKLCWRAMIKYCLENFPSMTYRDAEEVAQEVFIELFLEVAKGIREKNKSVRKWLFACLHFRCIDKQRKYKRDLSTEALEGDNHPDDIPSPEEIVDMQEFPVCLARCENQLTGENRIIYELLLEGLTYEEIAEETGIPKSTVGRIIKKRIYPQLRRCLKEQGFSQEDLRVMGFQMP